MSVTVLDGAGSGRDLVAELTEILSEVLGVPAVAADAKFFEDLGADSLTMAKFCARVRKRADLPKVSMKDIYRWPSVESLVGGLAPVVAVPAPTSVAEPTLPAEPVVAEPVAPVSVHPPVEAPAHIPAAGSAVAPEPVGRAQFIACGIAQLAVLLVLPMFISLLTIVGYRWLTPADGVFENYLRTVATAAAVVSLFFAMPVAAKWLLIGRWKPTEFPVYSWRYLRFWVVKSLIQKNPLVPMMTGSPLYGWYLRALGAKIGPGTAIFTNQVPVCADLLSIGAGTVIRRDTLMAGYHAESGAIRTGRVTLGDRVVVGTRAVIDIDTSIGDDGQLGHSSSLHPGQSIPAGGRWYGSPAQPGEVDFTGVEPAPTSPFRRTIFGVSQLLSTILVRVPLGLAVIAGAYNLAQYLVGRNWGQSSMTHFAFYQRALVGSAVLFTAFLLIWLPVVALLARLLRLLVGPGRVYQLHGLRHSAMRMITRITNSKFYGALTADTSLVVHYLGMLGYRLKPVEQTGTNFGTLTHDSPFAVSVGTGTVVADGLTVANVDYSASSFRVSPVAIGRHNFLGNRIAYPSGGRTGDNCLLGTMVMIPIDGPVRENVGLLGSPAFEIPRSVARDHGLAVSDPEARRRGLRAKNRYNAGTVALSLLMRWLLVFGMFLAAEAGGELYDYRSLGWWALVLVDIAYAVFAFGLYLAVELAVIRLAQLRPAGVSIYDRAFWRHERHWKLAPHGFLQILNGTPFKSVIWRILGARVGRRVFDDGAQFPEICFVTVGDHVTLNAGGMVQAHSQEDGAFKSDRITLGAGVTLGVAAFVHYGVTIGAGAVLGADSFLMKGEQIPPGEYWGGNPAQPGERFPVLRDGPAPPVGVPRAAAPAADVFPGSAAAAPDIPAFEPGVDRTDPTADRPAPRVDGAADELSESWVRLAAEFARLDALVAALDAGSNLEAPEDDGGASRTALPRQATGPPEPEH